MGETTTKTKRGPKPAGKKIVVKKPVVKNSVAKKPVVKNSIAKKAAVRAVLPTRRGPKPSEKKPKAKVFPPPTQLMSYLAAEAQNRQETPVQLAQRLGIGYVYLTQLLRGEKDTAKLGRDHLVAAAAYLDVPVAEVYLWAGALQSSDFVHEGKFRALSGDIFDVMSRHPHWGGFMPTRSEWDDLSDRAKVFVTLAFESATGYTVMDKTIKTMVPEGGATDESAPKETATAAA